jgi:hypothetical protein
MSDISMTKRAVLTSFGVYQMNNNPAGIGNECTHWIYAALFEARALDRDRRLGISQARVAYTWGRAVQPMGAQRGDIAQFHSFHNQFFVYLPDNSGGSQLWDGQKIRGPNHTGMVFVAPSSGTYYQLESHLHDSGGGPLMRIRGNTIYYESFAVAITTTDFSTIKGSSAWPADIDPSDSDDLLERIDWAGLRNNYSITGEEANRQIHTIRHNGSPSINGSDVAVLFRVQSIGNLRFYCPQESTARLGMNPAQLASEKADVIHLCIVGGRHGHDENEDAFGGDNKARRVHDNRFDWTFPQR